MFPQSTYRFYNYWVRCPSSEYKTKMPCSSDQCSLICNKSISSTFFYKMYEETVTLPHDLMDAFDFALLCSLLNSKTSYERELAWARPFVLYFFSHSQRILSLLLSHWKHILFIFDYKLFVLNSMVTKYR